MSEEEKQKNVVDISTAPSFSGRVTEALSVMSTLSKVTKSGVSRTPKPSKRRFDSGRDEHRLLVSRLSQMGNHPSKRGRNRRMVEAQLVAKICEDIDILKEQFGDTFPVKDALDILKSILIEEYA